MDIKLIPLSRLEADPKGTLSECVDSGQEALVVELLWTIASVSIQALEPAGDDPLINELLESSPLFRALVEKSKASPRRPFPGSSDS